MDPKLRRTLVLIGVAVILVCCAASAYLGIKAGHNARAASTFFAGLSFSLLFLFGSRRKKT
ncbi:MAG: hypothetical protein ABI432_00880 [Flavobacteriales bacterium]